MEGINMYGIDTRAGPSFPKELDINNFVSKLISKIICVE